LAAVALGARVGLPPAGAEHAGVRGRVRAAVGHVRERPPLRRLLVGCALVWACSAAILPLEVVLITDTLHAGGAAYGTVLSLWGLGAVAGSALVPKLRHHSLSALIVSSFALIGVSYLGMGLAPSVIVVCAFSLLGGVGNGVEVFAAMTAIQEQTADAYQTPVSGLVEAVAGASTGAGFILGGAIASLTSARAVYVVAALGILVVTAFLRANPHRPQAVYA
jgi:MFS family permease